MTKQGIMPGGCGTPPHGWKRRPATPAPPSDGEPGPAPLWKRVLIACRLSAPASPTPRPPSRS